MIDYNPWHCLSKDLPKIILNILLEDSLVDHDALYGSPLDIKTFISIVLSLSMMRIHFHLLGFCMYRILYLFNFLLRVLFLAKGCNTYF